MGVSTKTKVDSNFVIGGRELSGSEFVAQVDDVLLVNVKSALDRLGIRLVDHLEKNAPIDNGALKRSFGNIQVKETKTGYRLTIDVGVDYADYIDKGVRGVKHTIKNKKVYKKADGKYYQFENYYMPPAALKGLEGWMKRKNMEIKATNLINDDGRVMLPQISSSVKTLAYFIKKYGIEGTNFKKKSIDEAMPSFKVDMQEIGNDTLMLNIIK
jgi:hypothetical protein